ncbi:LysR family transcriptional regulator [Pseudomonas sp.]|uniref:LysR family transcriptional regulator n=1 Tax=Pseudomonas sp. TaxID=306 RepID=UPI00324228BE
MDHLNLRHLHYFWMIARNGSIVRAAEILKLSPQTLSGQLATLEANLGNALFQRRNRSLQLTNFGQTVFTYARRSSRAFRRWTICCSNHRKHALSTCP